jgi:tetratricopeptide (TPR) repeat protein
MKTLHITIIAITIFLVFSPCLKNSFVNYDDPKLITTNPLVVNDSTFRLTDFLGYNVFSPHYKPLVFLSWNLEHRLFGLNPTAFHFHNLLLHIANSILVYLLLLRLLPTQIKHRQSTTANRHSLPFLAALIFALHPLHVEPVAWASGRKDLLYAFFYLLSLLSYLLSQPTADRRPQILRAKPSGQAADRFFWLSISILSYIMVIGSKSMGITLIALLFLIDRIKGRKFDKSLILEKIPYLAVMILGFHVYGLFEDFTNHATGLTAGLVNQGYSGYPSWLEDLSPAYIRLLIISVRIVLWMVHTLVPVFLSPVYPQEAILEDLGYWVHLFPLILLALVALILINRKKAPWSGYGFLFFLITISPALAIADRGVGVFLSDRYMYLPMLGLVLPILIRLTAIKTPVHQTKKERRMVFGRICAVSVLFFLAFLSSGYSRIWHNGESLWTRVIERYPDEATGWNGRGQYYYRTGQTEKALQDYCQAISKDPAFYWAYPDRARIYYDSGQLDLALKDYLLLTKVDRWYAEAFTNLGAIYGIKGQYELAIQALNHAHRLKPTDPNTLLNRALSFMNMAQYDNSIADFNRFLQIKPGNAEVINAIGVCYLRKGDIHKAEQHFVQALEIKPEYEAGKKNLELVKKSGSS